MSEIATAGSTESASSTSSASSASSSTPSSSSSSSTPVDTASIAARVVANAESGSDTGEHVASPDPVPHATAGDPDDFEAQPAERIDSLGRKRENAIPHSRVQKMIAKREQKLIASVAKELGISKAEAELKLEDVTGALTERKTKLSDYETRLQQVQAIEAIMESDGDRFVRMLAEANPAVYGKFAKVLDGGAGAAAEAKAPAATNDPKPEPDYPLRDDSGKVVGMTYSLEGLEKLRAWDRREAVREAEAKMNERLQPFEQDRQERQKFERAQAIHRQASEAVTQQLERASKWVGFKEHEGDILAALQGDPTISLHDAYIQVVIPKLNADRTKIREDVLAEINGKPKSTSVTTTVGAQKPDRPRSTADIAREVMSKMGGAS